MNKKIGLFWLRDDFRLTKNNEIRYSKKAEFDENVVKNYFNKKLNLKNIKFKYSLLKDPFFLDSY